MDNISLYSIWWQKHAAGKASSTMKQLEKDLATN